MQRKTACPSRQIAPILEVWAADRAAARTGCPLIKLGLYEVGVAYAPALPRSLYEGVNRCLRSHLTGYSFQELQLCHEDTLPLTQFGFLPRLCTFAPLRQHVETPNELFHALGVGIDTGVDESMGICVAPPRLVTTTRRKG